MTNQENIFGHSIFGDAVLPPASADVTTVVQPAWGHLPVRQVLPALLPVSHVQHAVLPVPSTNVPPGSFIPVGARIPVVDVLPAVLDVNRVAPAVTPVSDTGIPTNSNYGLQARRRKHMSHPGVFHRPGIVGAYRYEVPHTFGPPTISGIGSVMQYAATHRNPCPPPMRVINGLCIGPVSGFGAMVPTAAQRPVHPTVYRPAHCPPGYTITGNPRNPCLRSMPQLSGHDWRRWTPPVHPALQGYGGHDWRRWTPALPPQQAVQGYGMSPDGLGGLVGLE